MNNKIYIVSEFVDTKQNSTGYYWFKIISAISDIDKKINVISSKKSIRIAEQNLNKSNVNFLFVKDKRISNLNPFRRAWNDILFSLRISLKILRQTNKNDIVMTGTNPAFLFFFLSLIKIFKKFKLVVLVHDIFPENLIPSKVISNKYVILLKPIIFLFNLAYSNTTSLIVIGRDMKQVLHEKLYSPNVIIKYIPNFVDFSDLDSPNEINKVGRKIVFNFFGNLGHAQGIDGLLEAILETNNENIKFNFIGNGVSEKLIKKFIEKHSHLDVNLHKDLLFENKNEMLFKGNVAIVSLAKGMRGLAVPSKAYFSLAANKPILAIADKNSELELLINENKNIGWFCTSGNPKEISIQIKKIYEDGINERNTEPFNVAKNSYEYKKISQQYINLIKEIN